MNGRQDALIMAAPFILTVREVAIAHKIVGTVGIVRVEPGAPNVIPGQVEVNMEIRGLDEAVLDKAEAKLAQLAQQGGGEFQHLAKKEGVISDPRLTEALVAF